MRYYEYYPDDTNNFFIMEFCEGGSLYDYALSLSKCPEMVISRIIGQLLKCVDYCHRMNIFNMYYSIFHLTESEIEN